MPSKPSWILRLPDIRSQLSALQSPVLDRAAIELAFGLRRRQAIALMHRFHGFLAGKTFLVDRASLLRQLDELQSGPGFRQERARRVRVAEDLDRARKALPGKAIRIQAPADVLERHLDELPGVSLRPGELRVEFHGTEDLLRQLLELAMAIQNDYRKFEQICERNPGSQ